MEEPKFRGYSLETDEWHYGHGWCEIEYTEEYLKDNGINKRAMLYTKESPIECELESMGSYTGFDDGNGNNIYSGDLCKREDDLFLVKYSREYGQWYLHLIYNKTVMNNVLVLTYFTCRDMNIVGNLFEQEDLAYSK